MSLISGARELVRSFAYKSVLKSNILSNSGSFSPLSPNTSMIAGSRGSSPSMISGSKLLGTYYLRLQEIKDYEVTELTNTVVGIYKDYIINYLNKDDNIITLKNAQLGDAQHKYQTRINSIFKDLGIIDEIKSHLFEIIYNGQYCIKLDWNEEDKKFVKYDLQNPYNVVSVIRKGEVESHLVVSKEGKILEVAPNSILKFGGNELHLINDMEPSYFGNESEDTIIKDHSLVAGYPLYYNIVNKIKEYLLKDQVVSLLSIKDLIQPLLLLIRVDKNTSPDEANRLALNTENLINKYSDISAILGANFSINDLIDSLINNIRVIPDYSSALGDMNSIDLTKISNKIQEIRGDQENSKDGILTSLGIPRALFSGDVTKWEAIKSSERLNSRVNSLITQISDSVKYSASVIYYLISGTKINEELIECNLFTKTQVDYNNAISSADIVNSLLTSINQILDTTQNMVSNNKLVDAEAYCNYVINQLKVIDPDILTFVGEKQVKALMQELIKQRDSMDVSPGGYRGFSATKE